MKVRLTVLMEVPDSEWLRLVNLVNRLDKMQEVQLHDTSLPPVRIGEVGSLISIERERT